MNIQEHSVFDFHWVLIQNTFYYKNTTVFLHHSTEDFVIQDSF